MVIHSMKAIAMLSMIVNHTRLIDLDGLLTYKKQKPTVNVYTYDLLFETGFKVCRNKILCP